MMLGGRSGIRSGLQLETDRVVPMLILRSCAARALVPRSEERQREKIDDQESARDALRTLSQVVEKVGHSRRNRVSGALQVVQYRIIWHPSRQS